MEQVLDLLGFQPSTRSGVQWYGSCPLDASRSGHRRSFSVNPGGLGCYYRHGCRSHGNPLELWAAATKRPLHQAGIDLCHRLGRDARRASHTTRNIVTRQSGTRCPPLGRLRETMDVHYAHTGEEATGTRNTSQADDGPSIISIEGASITLITLKETVNAFGRKTYGMRNAADTPPLSFCLDEALALYLGRRFLEPLAGTLFWDAAQSAFRKIRASLGEQALAYVETMACFFHTTKVGVSDYGPKAKLLDALTQAIEDSRAVHLLYQSEQATEPASRDVYPHTFAYHHGSIYLIAHDPNAGKIKHYPVI